MSNYNLGNIMYFKVPGRSVEDEDHASKSVPSHVRTDPTVRRRLEEKLKSGVRPVQAFR